MVTVSSLTTNEVSEFFCWGVSIVNKCVPFVEKKKYGSQISDNGHEYERVQAVQRCGKQMTMCLIQPVANFPASVNDLCEHALRDVDDTDMVGITIQNQGNQNDKPIGNIFRRKD